MPERCPVFGAALAVALTGQGPAAASEPAAPAQGADPAPEPLAQRGIPPGSVPWHPWPILDPHLSSPAARLTGGLVWDRSVDDGPVHRGFEATFGESRETRVAPWIVRLEVEYGLRRTTDDHWVLALPRYSYAAGVALGAIEATARCGVSVAEVHFGAGGFGLGFFSPRVAAGAAFRAGALGIGLVAFGEYAWQWTGGPDARVRGVLLEVSLSGPPPGLPAWARVEKR